MRNECSYSMKQVHKLAMTNEMQLSIRILQMSAQELNEYVEKEFVENPIIEISENSSSSIKDSCSNIRIKKSSNSQDLSPLNFISKEKSLKDFLHEQVLELEKDKVLRKTADYIVECLDDSGYFKVEEEVLCEKLNVDIEIVKRALHLVQSLEPAGIGARSLEECLLLQLSYLKIDNFKIIEIIKNNLSDIGNDNYKKIAGELNISRLEAKKYCEVIRKLEPKPSRGFYTGENYKYIVPDAEIVKTEEGLELIMNGQAVPSLVISNTYKKILNGDSDNNTKSYVKEKLSKAEFLIKSIEERKNTLKNILEYITKNQYDYFMGKEKYLKPMMIKEAAEELSYSESTVSRAVKDKYIITPLGIVKVKDLFKVNAIKNNKNNVSVSSIKNTIKKIIDDEDKNNPISDQAIVGKIKESGIDISRRTIAKYREELGIKSSHKRRAL